MLATIFNNTSDTSAVNNITTDEDEDEDTMAGRVFFYSFIEEIKRR